jgi:hypothetical protein
MKMENLLDRFGQLTSSLTQLVSFTIAPGVKGGFRGFQRTA